MRYLLLLAMMGLLLSCVSVNPEAQHVRLTSNPQAVEGCTYLGEVKSATGLGGLLRGTGKSNTGKVLQNKAAAMQGDVVLISIDTEFMTAGEAYQCKGTK